MFRNVTLTRYLKDAIPVTVTDKFNNAGVANYDADVKPYFNTMRPRVLWTGDLNDCANAFDSVYPDTTVDAATGVVFPLDENGLSTFADNIEILDLTWDEMSPDVQDSYRALQSAVDKMDTDQYVYTLRVDEETE